MHILTKLVTPLKYLLISHPQKSLVDIIIPVLMSALVIVFMLFTKPSILLIGKDGLIDSISAFAQFLTGFYVASLAAVATFPNKNMDCLMDGEPLTLAGKSLTRRQYLSYMFGYLAFVGICLAISGKILVLTASSIYGISIVISSSGYLALSLFILFVYLALVFSIFMVTLYALYYLTEKIHAIKSEFTSGFLSSSEKTSDDGK